MAPGSLQSAVTMLEAEGWTGLGIDNENLASSSQPPTTPGNNPTKDKGCQKTLDAICNNVSINAACTNRLLKDYGSNFNVLPLDARLR